MYRVSVYLHLSRLNAIEKNKAKQAEWIVLCVCFLLSLLSSFQNVVINVVSFALFVFVTPWA